MTGAAEKGSRLGRFLKRGALVLLIAVIAAGAAWWLLVEEHPLPAQHRSRAPLPAAVAERFAYAKEIKVHLEPEFEREGLLIRTGTFLVERTGRQGPKDARLEIFRAKGVTGKAPAIILTPILGGDYEIERIIGRDLASHGMHVVIVDRDLPADPKLESFEDAMAGMIAARRHVVDWLETLPEVDHDRIGAYGVSLGGLVTTMLAAVEPRIRASVIIMAGGDLASVIGRSTEHEPTVLRETYGLKGEPAGEALARFEAEARKVFQTCPLLLAPYADPESIFMVTTRRDTSVPSDTQMRLHEGLGRPAMISLPTGHYTAIVYLPMITSRARAFLAARFGAAPAVAAAGR